MPWQIWLGLALAQIASTSCAVVVGIVVAGVYHEKFSGCRLTSMALRIRGVLIELKPNEVTTMVGHVTYQIPHTLELSLVYLDQHGQPMVPQPVPGSVEWSNTVPATEALMPSADGQTAALVPAAPGSDQVSVSVSVSGVSVSATLDVTVEAEPQVLSSVQIVEQVQ